MSLVKPSVTLFANAAMVIARASTCASGRKTSSRSPLSSRVGEGGLGAADLVDQVGVRQLAALGPAGGSRRVDQRGRIGGLDGREPGVQLGAVGRLARLGQRVQRGGRRTLDAEHLAQIGQIALELLDLVGVRVGLGEHQHRTRIAQHELDLLGGAGLIDRHGHRADRQDREIDDGPLVPGRGKHRHPIAGLHPLGDQSECDRTDLARDLAAVTSAHAPSTRRCKITWSGSSRSWE